jgi:hypothetical protein
MVALRQQRHCKGCEQKKVAALGAGWEGPGNAGSAVTFGQLVGLNYTLCPHCFMIRTPCKELRHSHTT